jgi:hypothetical protein
VKDFDLSDVSDDNNRIAWCANCDEPVETDEIGRCIACRDNGEPGQDIELVVIEPIPASSPRSSECCVCGADIGEFCHPGEDGAGYNHAARVEDLAS